MKRVVLRARSLQNSEIIDCKEHILGGFQKKTSTFGIDFANDENKIHPLNLTPKLNHVISKLRSLGK